MRCKTLLLAAFAVLLLSAAAFAADPVVRSERPRVFFREKAWDGPSIEKLRQWASLDEYKQRAGKLPGTRIGKVILYLMHPDEASGTAAVEALRTFQVGGDTPSYSGIECQKLAAMYDWLHDHPALDEATRKAVIAQLEKWGDGYLKYLKGGGPTPFYSRLSGALAGLTVIGLSLAGDSPKADEYVRYAAMHLREKLGTIRQMEDGATGGGSYGHHHEFTDLANLVAAWRSATDWDAAKWIAENQGDWLRRQLLYQIWITYPNGWFVKDGDLWGGSMMDKTQFRMQIDAVTGMYHSGVGRTFADQMARRYPKWGGYPSDYHTEYVWEFFVFNNPEIKPVPLSTLGRMEVFSPKLHGLVCMRDSWEPDATIIHFKCGESVDHHGTWDEGKFIVFKRVPLAIKNGGYLGGYQGQFHQYYKGPWSANCVVFQGPGVSGLQPHIDFDGTPSWAEWKAARDARYKRPPTGVLLATESNEKFARAAGDLTGSCPPGCSWQRELVFLGYKYLLVLDRVKTAPGIASRWLLHTIHAPKVDGTLVVADNGEGRLFCRTLLPADAKVVSRSGVENAYLHVDAKGVERNIEAAPGKYYDKFDPAKVSPDTRLGEGLVNVTPAEPAGGAAEVTYLHVLLPTDTGTAEMPACTLGGTAEQPEVTLGGLTYKFSR